MTPSDSRHDWEKTGAHEVAHNVYRIPLPLPGDALRAVNVYAIVDGPQIVMVDAGWALEESQRRLEAALGQLGHDLSSISRFLVTHLHRDHYTQAVAVRRTLGTKVLIGSGEEPSLEQVLRHSTDIVPRALLQRLCEHGATVLVERIHGTRNVIEPIDRSDWGRPDGWIEGGDLIELSDRTLRAVTTPGHTRGHVVFYDSAANLLFSGDHVLPHITPSVGFESAPVDSPLSDYLASLCAILALPDATLLPAHGPAGGSTRARTIAIMEHHRRRLEATYSAVAAGSRTGFEVAAALRWTTRDRRLEDLDAFNQMIAVNETIAHLDVLVEQGRLTREREAGGVAYAT